MRTKTYILAASAVITAAVTFGAGSKVDANLPKDYPTGNKIIRASTGGMLWQPFTGAGKLVVVNLQETVPTTSLEAVKTAIMEETHINIVFETDSAKRGELTVLIEDVDGDRALTVFPEQNEARVNVGPLKVGSPTPEKLAARTRKELLRAFAFIAGAAMSPAEISLMGKVATPTDLDLLRENIPNEVEMRFSTYLPKIGVKPYRAVPYKLACEEGWAPEPTNRYQKAIWDKVHTMPASPMKIEFDPKKGR